MRYVTLVPAYGRDYKSAKEVKAAWDAGHDFKIQDISHPDDGRYICKNNTKNPDPPTTYNIRYKKLTQICVIKPPKK